LDQRPVILSFGGSLGAQKIHEALVDLIARSGKNGRYQHIHAYGKYGGWFPDKLREAGVEPDDCPNLDIRPYIDNMPVCMAAADLVISRAGAITLSEIQAMGKPAILIPSPNVAENHQYHNAMALVDAGAAEIIEESNLSGAAVIEKADAMLHDEATLAKFSENSKKMAITNANERIYSVVKQVLNLL
ncbi:MAG: UDP-N-acetylglucosamine--N-acetylmuramyl-(pentapeptide) pyrophosphoryl-undecaprenol N-acetylglucosamine transferase, partial [Ruminococcus sp.]|nr:UDP-N-acetylglucosamine--N-acetylmuramyl-(pentapeptide) pyrophosphoryl-undecaprenol N-acetylglucosamine transferase [Ruminococcus sp.]